MIEKRFALILIALIVLSFVVTSFVSADAFTDSILSLGKTANDYFLLKDDTYGSIGAIGKWLILLLIVTLIYSSFSFVEFPENTGMKILLSVIIGFLSTILISQQEVVTIIISYTALGIALVTFLPILILGFFTMVVATKAKPIGIFLQKILWILYSVYLFIKAGFLFVAKIVLQNNGNVGENPIFKFFLGDANQINTLANNTDNTILLTLIIVSIAVWIICVWRNDFIVAWMASEKTDADSLAHKTKLNRAREAVDNLSSYLEGK